MLHPCRWVRSLLFLALLLQPALAVDSFEDAAAIRKDILPNGMKVLYVPSHNAPIVASVVAVKAGSIYETAALSGASHFRI